MLCSLASGLRTRGQDVHLAAVIDRSAEHPLFSPLRAAGVQVHPLPVPRRAWGVERASVEALCRRLAPDVVHTHGLRADLVDAPVARFLRVPSVTTVHGFAGGGW